MGDIETMLNMNEQELKNVIVRGNMELALFSHIHENKKASKKFVKQLYHYMNGSTDKTVASKLGDYMTMLKHLTSVTRDQALNEFLGAFDKMCSDLYTKK